MDDTHRCCNCRFYDDMDSSCKAHPPVYAGDRRNDDGVVVATFRQPYVSCSWVDWCGEWQTADESQTKEQRWTQIKELRFEWAKSDPQLASVLKELYG